MALMTDRLDLPSPYRKVVEALLREHVPDAAVWAYGSRVNGMSHPGSDLDLVLRSPTLEQLGDGFHNLVEAFQESNIPILIQVHDWARLPESFHREIERDYVVVQEGAKQTAPAEWREANLGELIELKRGYDLPQRNRTPGSVPLVSSSGVTYYHTEAKVRGPGVVTGRYGTLGEVFFVPSDFWPLNTTLYVRDFKGNDPRFISYFLRELDFFAYSDKAAVPGLNRNHLHQAMVRYPTDIGEQRAIAHVLGTLDDKIELNRRMNETLEEMARALFQSWFVDFDPVRAKMEGRDTGLPPDLAALFPDRLVDSERGEVPEGWGLKTLGDYTTLNPESWSRSNIPEEVEYVDLTNTKWGVIETTQHFLWGDAPSRAKRVLRAGDTIVGTVRPGNGSYSLVGYDGLTGSTGFAVLRPIQSRYRELVYLAATGPDNIELLAHRADGAAYPAVRPEFVSETQVAIPTSGTYILDCFSTTVGPVLDKIESTEMESRTLAAQRDELLPKLVSGEIEVG